MFIVYTVISFAPTIIYLKNQLNVLTHNVRYNIRKINLISINVSLHHLRNPIYLMIGNNDDT